MVNLLELSPKSPRSAAALPGAEHVPQGRAPRWGRGSRCRPEAQQVPPCRGVSLGTAAGGQPQPQPQPQSCERWVLQQSRGWPHRPSAPGGGRGSRILWEWPGTVTATSAYRVGRSPLPVLFNPQTPVVRVQALKPQYCSQVFLKINIAQSRYNPKLACKIFWKDH